MWLMASMAQTGMLLAGVALLILILFRRTYRYYGRRRRSGNKKADSYLTKSPRPTKRASSLSSAPSDVLSWHVEMHETARDLKAELDSKMRLLQLLIAQARQEADRLTQIVADANSVAVDRSETLSPARRTTPLPGSPQRQSEIFMLADQGQSAAEIADRTGSPLGEIELILSLRSARAGE
jgi:hypothetical protein